MLSHPGGWGGFGPTADLGSGPHSLAGCPTLNIFLKSTVFNTWLGQESCMLSRPQGISRQNSANFNLSWCWGSQLKPPSWECSLLAPKHPQLCSVDPEGISLDGLFARCFGGNSSETQAISCLLRSHSTLFESPGNQLVLRIFLPQGTRKHEKKMCCSLVDTFCNYNVITLAHRYNSQDLTSVQLLSLQPHDCSMPGFPVHHQLPELAQTHVHRVGDAIQPSHLLLSPSPPAFNLSQYQGLF